MRRVFLEPGCGGSLELLDCTFLLLLEVVSLSLESSAVKSGGASLTMLTEWTNCPGKTIILKNNSNGTRIVVAFQVVGE